jgi:hypothetical protein
LDHFSELYNFEVEEVVSVPVSVGHYGIFASTISAINEAFASNSL